MARPALSGSRALQVIDLMAAAPDRAFTLSDLVRATETNFASCHAVLIALVERAYLVRDEARKTYRLGPALYAAGQAMAAHDPLLGGMQAAAHAVAERTGLIVGISAWAGEELVGVSRHGDARFAGQGLHVGQRVPFQPPIGATLIAWSDDSEIDRWIARGGLALDSAEAEALRADLAAIRRRGYLATLATESYAAISSAVARRYRGKAPRPAGPPADLFQPREIDPHASYDIAFIGAPVFDSSGHPLYSIVLSGFGGRIDGAAVEAHAAELTRLCADVMRLGTRA